jgi:hypothetical protein
MPAPPGGKLQKQTLLCPGLKIPALKGCFSFFYEIIFSTLPGNLEKKPQLALGYLAGAFRFISLSI